MFKKRAENKLEFIIYIRVSEITVQVLEYDLLNNLAQEGEVGDRPVVVK